MEPKLPIQNPGLERVPAGLGQHTEHAPTVPTPERSIERGTERAEHGVETTPLVSAQAVLPAPISLPPISPSVSVQADDATDSDAVNTPLVANDDDLIEKEWVDKAKKIITQTKDDPYRREHEVSKLQADYLRKRYGREISTSE